MVVLHHRNTQRGCFLPGPLQPFRPGGRMRCYIGRGGAVLSCAGTALMPAVEAREPVDRRPSGTGSQQNRSPDLEDAGGGPESLVCRECRHVITRTTERVSVQGTHAHTFANPAGILFQIGCFQSAMGCTCVGAATEQWSWFSGFSWRVAVCRACMSHLGWQYTRAGGASFYGLILNRLAGAC